MKRHIPFSFLIAFVIAPAVFIGIGACNKKAAKYNPDFVGTWYTVAAYDSTYEDIRRSELIIEKRNGLYNYRCQDTCDTHLCDCVVQQTGRALVSFNKDKLKIGSNSSYTIRIDKEPYQDSAGNWMMQLDGLTFYKQP